MEETDIYVKLARVDDRSKSNCHRLDELEKKQENSDKMLSNIALIAQRQDAMDSDIKEMKSDVKKLADRSGKRWDAIVDKAMLAVVAGIVGYILFRLGLGV